MNQTFQGHAPAISCEGCAGSIKRSLSKLPGIQQVNVDVSQKQINVQYDALQINEEGIQAQLDKAGFPAN